MDFKEKKDKIPIMDDKRVKLISQRYIELYENIIGEKFIKRNTDNMLNDIESNINIAMKYEIEKNDLYYILTPKDEKIEE